MDEFAMGSSTEHSAYGRHPQPVGPRPDPGRLRWRVRRGRGRLRGAAGHRHRHRRLDPPAGRRDRHDRDEADVRRGLALRPGRAGQLPRPGRSGDPDRARRGDAARADRRPRPARLHDASTQPVPDLVGAVRRRRERRPDRRADRRGHRARRRGLSGRCPHPLPGVGRPDGQGRRRGRRGLVPELRPRAGDVLPDPAGRGLEQPRQVRRDALRPAVVPEGSHPARRT